MEIPFRSEFDSIHWAFVMTLEPQNFAPLYDGDIPRLNVQVTFKRSNHNDNQPQGLYPVVLELHGKLTRANEPFELGVALLPSEEMPINLVSTNVEQYVNLSFVFSARYLQLLEEQRASQQEQVMILVMKMWGVVAMVRPRTNPPGVPAHLQYLSGEVIRFEKVNTGPSAQPIRIERSAWVDRILPGLGYRRSLLIELPLIRTPAVPEAYQRAAEALDMARRAFNSEDYRGAVKYGRDVLDYLGNASQSRQITTFCKEHLEPLIGKRKSRAVDRSLNALRDMTNMASHIGPFVADRAIAAYIIETLALNLRYISAVLG